MFPDNKDFETWSTRELINYVLEYHHPIGRRRGHVLLNQARQTLEAAGAQRHIVEKIVEQLEISIPDLDSHFDREEAVLFPYLIELCTAEENKQRIEAFHCGTILNPIHVMMNEHAMEQDRYGYLETLTDNFTAPAEATEAYRNLLADLKTFVTALREHIRLENDFVFPQATELEAQWA